MTQLLPYECKPSGQAPISLHYFCEVFASELYRCGSGQAGVPEQAQRQARPRVVDWFEYQAPWLWRAAGKPGQFDWDVLYSWSTRPGRDRLDEQVIRVNINPSDCCTTSAAGSGAARLKTDHAGFAHLYLAGSWIDTGLNTECIEAAVMSGMQAARAISGEDIAIPGEHFMHPAHENLGPCDLVRRYVAAGLGIL
jgi:hypothetical protein